MNSKICKIGKYDLKLSHFLIISILILSFSTSFLLRTLPANYGWELHEFDPFFNYRATEYLVNNGFEKYSQWNDELSWYPVGRDVTSNSQVMLHTFTALFYWLFGNSISLYDFTILFPVIVGSLTCIVIFSLVRLIGGTTAGLISSLFFSISLPILVRGQVGWFKSEPLGLFLGILGTYLFVSSIRSQNHISGYVKSSLSGVIIIFALSAWGGNLFFLIPLGILFCLLPLVRKDHDYLIKIIPIFTISLIGISFLFERVGTNFSTGLEGLSIIFPTICFLSIIFVQKKSNPETKLRNGIITLIILFIILSVILILNDNLDLVSLPTHRYLNAIFPLLTTSDPLTDSVSEHATLNIFQSFQFHSVLMIFSGIGIWLLLKNNLLISNEMKIFSLSFGLFGVYIGSAFMRLEVLTSIAIIILSSVAISLLLQKIKINNKNYLKKNYLQYCFFSFIIILLIIPLFLRTTANVLAVGASVTPTIKNGGIASSVSTNDWRESLEWIRDNTPDNSVIASWWDYGYWIQTISNRPTLVDNSTLIDHRIKSLAKIFFETPDDAWKSLRQMETDYFVIFIAGEQLPFTTIDKQNMFLLNKGGDDSKKFWFAKIAQVDMSEFFESDLISGTPKFWNETFLGKIIPFELLGYVNIQSDEISNNYISGWTPIYVNQNKFSSEDSPFKLVYSSSSLSSPVNEQIIGVFVYEINKDYKTKNEKWNSPVTDYPRKYYLEN